jgi:hypothetical protein
MLLSLSGYEKPDLTRFRPAGLWDAHVRTEGVRALYESVCGEAFIEMPLQKQRYGDREFDVRDPNCYILVLGSDARVVDGSAV